MYRLVVRPFCAVVVAGSLLAAPAPFPRAPRDRKLPSRPEITFRIRPYPDGRHPGNRGAAIRVRLDRDRLRAHDLSCDDVMKAFAEATVLGSPRRVDPPPGVVFVTRLYRPEQYEKLILKANAEGEVVRLEDVARVELLAEREAQEAAPSAAAGAAGR